jgi:hypothetical protein
MTSQQTAFRPVALMRSAGHPEGDRSFVRWRFASSSYKLGSAPLSNTTSLAHAAALSATTSLAATEPPAMVSSSNSDNSFQSAMSAISSFLRIVSGYRYARCNSYNNEAREGGKANSVTKCDQQQDQSRRPGERNDSQRELQLAEKGWAPLANSNSRTSEDAAATGTHSRSWYKPAPSFSA